MSNAFANLTSGTSTTNGSATASVTVPDDAAAYLSVAVAQDGGVTEAAAGVITLTIGGTLSLTFNEVDSLGWGFRRKLFILRAVNTSGSNQSGTVTLTFGNFIGGFVYREHQWAIDRVTGIDTADPDDAAVNNSTTSGPTSLALPDVGTPDTDDSIYAAFAFENGSDGFALDAALTELGSQTGGADVRSLKSGYDLDAGDETPSCSWNTGSYSCGGIGFIVNAAAAGGGRIMSSLVGGGGLAGSGGIAGRSGGLAG